MRFSTSLDSELCAGEMLRLAGFSSGTGVGGRGGRSARRVRFYCRVLRSHFAYHTFLLECFMFVSRLLFAAQRQTGQLATGSVSIPRGSGSPLERSQMLCGYRTCLVHFRLAGFFPAIPTNGG